MKNLVYLFVLAIYKKAKSIERNNASWGAFPQYRAQNALSVFGQYNYAGYSNMNYLTW